MAGELENISRLIRSFVADAGHLDQLMVHSTSEKSSKQLKKITKRLYSRRRQAFALHRAFETGWLHNCQHTEHNTLLLLHLNSPTNPTPPPAESEFHVFFQWFCEAEPEARWIDSAVVMNTDSLVLPVSSGGPTRYASPICDDQMNNANTANFEQSSKGDPASKQHSLR